MFLVAIGWLIQSQAQSGASSPKTLVEHAKHSTL